MKKKSALSLWTLILIFILTSCVNFTIIPSGKWVSDSPEMYIEMDVPISTKITGIADQYEHVGELKNEDGSVTKILFRGVAGGFTIYVYHNDGIYEMKDEIYKGTYILEEDTLILKTTDNMEIILKKVNKNS